MQTIDFRDAYYCVNIDFQMTTHRSFECGIFARQKLVQPNFLKQASDYILINVLRLLLLKRVDRDKWEILNALESHCQVR